MKFSRSFLPLTCVLAIFVLVLGSAPSTVRAQGGEALPADVYLEGYMAFQDASKALDEGNIELAAQKAQQSREFLVLVSRTAPDWNPQMISYRLSKLEELAGKIQAQSPQPRPQPTTPVGGGSGLPQHGTFPDRGSQPPVGNGGGLIGNPDALTGELERRFRAYDLEIAKRGERNRELEAALNGERERYRSAMDDVARWKRLEQAARSGIAELEQDLNAAKLSGAEQAAGLETEIAVLRNELDKATQGLSGANGRTSELMTELEEAKAEIARVSRERDELTDEVARQKIVINSYEEGADEGMRQLLAENQRLQDELKVAVADVDRLSSESEDKDAQIAQLSEQVRVVREQLAMIKEENADFQGQIADLSGRLRETEKLLGGATPGELAPELMAENAVLRRVILRQLSRQARMMWTQELIVAELNKSEIDSTALLEQIASLTDNPILVGEDEQSLFREPIVGDLGDGTGSMTTVVRLSGNGGPPVSPPPATLTGKDLLREAGAKVTDGDLPTAEAYYEKYIADAEGGVADRRVHANLGIIRLRLGDYAGADEALRQALLAAPDNPRSHYLLGVNSCWQGKDDDAYDALDSATKLNPENLYAQHYLGVVSARLGNIEAAEAAFGRAVALDPTYADSHFNLAVIHATAEDPRPADAERHYRLAIDNGAEEDPKMEQLLQSLSEAGEA